MYESRLGNFIAITASSDLIAAEKLYQRAVDKTKTSAGTVPSSVIRNAWCLAASFPRQNGSDSAIVSDASTGTWLAVVGTCFHESGNHDPHFLLQQFISQGAEKLSRSLEGFFVIIAGNGTRRDITVITDIVGSCHFFSRQVGGAIALSSSSLLLASLAEAALDPVGCQEFLATGIIYEDRTAYREIKKLPAASIITFRDGNEVSKQLYWDMSALAPESISLEKATEPLWHALVSAATRIGERFENVVCDLTGGYDSRAMTAAFVGAGKQFTTAVSGPSDSPDVLVSGGLARKLGLGHQHCVCDEPISLDHLRSALYLSDGEYDVVEYGMIGRLHRQLSLQFQVSINGSFGEIARGYWWELLVPHTGARRPLDSHRVAERRYALTSSEDMFRRQVRINLLDHMTSVTERSVEGLTDFPNTFQMDVAYLRMRMQRWQGRIASSTNKIWPCLSPFMFRSVLETMLQTCFLGRQRSLVVRKMLARYQPEIAEFPLEHGYPAVPASVWNLPKFWPIIPSYGRRAARKFDSYWRRRVPSQAANNTRLQLWTANEVRALLDSEKMRSASILEPSALASFLKASQSPDFSRNAEWNRLLSLEMALASAA